MRALVIGGTRFVGAAIVDELVSRGAEITVFSRGETNPDRFADLDRVRGDRATDLDRLGDRRFDAVFDSCGYLPEVVERSAAAAADAFTLFVSSASVYARSSAARVDEDAALETADPEYPLEHLANYGAAKALCERALLDRLGDRLAILRPGLIVGPGDYTDRYPYWAARLSRPGPVLCPGDGRDPAQLIDARDLARFAVDIAASRTAGCFNATGPAQPATFADLISASAGAAIEPVWAPAAFLAEREVGPWGDMPCWLPRDHESAGILRLDLARAQDAGLTTRPWAETAADTRAWLEASGRTLPFEHGLSAERERELLQMLG